MSPLSKLFGIWAAQRAWFEGSSLVRRFLWGTALFVWLAVTAGVAAGGLALGLFYAFYLALVRYGLEPYAALATACLVALLLVCALGALVCCRLRRTPKPSRRAAGTARAAVLVDAFLDGMLEPPSGQEPVRKRRRCG
jgi:hypothetical protein